MPQLISIPKATDGKTEMLIDVFTKSIATVIEQVEAPGIAYVELRRTPPETVVANTAESPIVVAAEASRET